MKVLKELLYSNDHEWVKVDGDKAYIGITDFAQSSLGDVVFIEFQKLTLNYRRMMFSELNEYYVAK